MEEGKWREVEVLEEEEDEAEEDVLRISLPVRLGGFLIYVRFHAFRRLPTLLAKSPIKERYHQSLQGSLKKVKGRRRRKRRNMQRENIPSSLGEIRTFSFLALW